jgi:hypothetical protein
MPHICDDACRYCGECWKRTGAMVCDARCPHATCPVCGSRVVVPADASAAELHEVLDACCPPAPPV